MLGACTRTPAASFRLQIVLPTESTTRPACTVCECGGRHGLSKRKPTLRALITHRKEFLLDKSGMCAACLPTHLTGVDIQRRDSGKPRCPVVLDIRCVCVRARARLRVADR